MPQGEILWRSWEKLSPASQLVLQLMSGPYPGEIFGQSFNFRCAAGRRKEASGQRIGGDALCLRRSDHSAGRARQHVPWPAWWRWQGDFLGGKLWDGAQEDFWMLSFKAHPFYWLICVFCGYLTLKNQLYPAVCINNERVDLAKWHWRSWWAFCSFHPALRPGTRTATEVRSPFRFKVLHHVWGWCGHRQGWRSRTWADTGCCGAGSGPQANR